MSSVTKTLFGKLKDGRKINIFKIENKNGAYVTVSEYGCNIVNVVVPDRDGKLGDVVLGYDTLKEYEDQSDCMSSSYFGVTVGRVANRIGGAEFTLNGKTYSLTKNNGNNNLHSAEANFGYLPFKGTEIEDGVLMKRVSLAGEGGFPGNLVVGVAVTFDDDNVLKFEYKAVADDDTLVAMTNHSFFNLGGQESGPITDEYLKLNAPFMTPINGEILPIGEVKSVKGTPFDFMEYKRIGDDIGADDEQIKLAGGFDHCWILKKTEPGAFEFAASVHDDRTGRGMDCFTTKPAIQFYSGNFIVDGGKGKYGATYCYRGALCLETQYVPNGMQCPHLGSPVLRKGEEYHHVTAYRFYTL